jgi:hypothetical protein
MGVPATSPPLRFRSLLLRIVIAILQAAVASSSVRAPK